MAKRPPKKHHKASDTLGLNEETFLPQIRDRNQIDYEAKLSPEDARWLARFNDNHAGFFKNDGADIITDEGQRRAVRREVKEASTDGYGMAKVGLDLLHPDTASMDSGELTWEGLAAPEQLWLTPTESREHQRLTSRLAALRAQLPRYPQRFDWRVQPLTPEYEQTLKQLVRLNEKQLKRALRGTRKGKG